MQTPRKPTGSEFVEYAAPDPQLLRDLFAKMGFPAVARHRRKDVTLHRQGDINFIINAEPDSFAQGFAREHGPCACAMAFRVKDAPAAMARALSLGAVAAPSDVGHMELNIPAIKGIGDSLIYFVDRYGAEGSIYDVDFRFFADAGDRMAALDSGLTYIDHLTHNVMRGRIGALGGILRAALQFSRDPLFRHRGQSDRAGLQGDDLAVRQDAHSPERKPGRAQPDRGVS